MSKVVADKKKNITSETFRLNKNVEVDSEIIDFLAKSNNKSGLIKDAIMMYKALVESGAYQSPYLVSTAVDWTRILTNIDPSKIIGRSPETEKEKVKEEIKSYQPQQQPVEEKIVEEEIYEDVYEEIYDEIEDDDDNEVDF